MTGRELLRMFANMRGIPKADIEQTVKEAITNLNLDVHADKLVNSSSAKLLLLSNILEGL